MKIPKEYNILLDYPEFNIDTIRNKYKQWIEDDQQSGEGHFDYPNWIFDIQPAFEYVVMVYAPDSELSSIKSLRERKEIALKKADIPKDQWGYIIKNENFMIGDMATRLFRELMDFDYEILISAKEAVETLLEVVRKPISTILQDDKERNAIKAKRECFDDAQYLMGKIKEMMGKLKDENEDVADHVKKSVFNGGLAEKMSEKFKKS